MNFDILFRDFTAVIAERRGIMTEDLVRYYFFACMLRQDPVLDHYTLEYPYSKMQNDADSDISLHEPHCLNALDGRHHKELDLFYDDGDPEGECLCVEIKYHRKANSTLTYPENAGALFNDMRRLQIIQGHKRGKTIHRLFVYITDEKMNKYFIDYSKEKDAVFYRKELERFYSLPLTNSAVFSSYKSYKMWDSANPKNVPPNTFLKEASCSFRKTHFVLNIKSLFKALVLNYCSVNGTPSKTKELHIRVYEVDPCNCGICKCNV